MLRQVCATSAPCASHIVITRPFILAIASTCTHLLSRCLLPCLPSFYIGAMTPLSQSTAGCPAPCKPGTAPASDPTPAPQTNSVFDLHAMIRSDSIQSLLQESCCKLTGSEPKGVCLAQSRVESYFSWVASRRSKDTCVPLGKGCPGT